MAVDTKCGICGETTGRFRFRFSKGDWVHVGKCIQDARRDAAKGVFPYTLEHVTPGQPIVVENLRQLRAVERQHGVFVQAFNSDAHNFE